jgi:hypothetical protein
LDHLGGLVGKMSKRMEYGTNMDVWYYNIIYIYMCVCALANLYWTTDVAIIIHIIACVCVDWCRSI